MNMIEMITCENANMRIGLVNTTCMIMRLHLSSHGHNEYQSPYKIDSFSIGIVNHKNKANI